MHLGFIEDGALDVLSVRIQVLMGTLSSPHRSSSEPSYPLVLKTKEHLILIGVLQISELDWCSESYVVKLKTWCLTLNKQASCVECLHRFWFTTRNDENLVLPLNTMNSGQLLSRLKFRCQLNLQLPSQTTGLILLFYLDVMS